MMKYIVFLGILGYILFGGAVGSGVTIWLTGYLDPYTGAELRRAVSRAVDMSFAHYAEDRVLVWDDPVVRYVVTGKGLRGFVDDEGR